jgi:hypothetical protein
MFEVIGETVNRTINSTFAVTNEPIFQKIEEFGEITSGKTGTITQRVSGLLRPVVNAKVTAFKDGIVYDYDTTDTNGQYTLCLEDGIYDIEIKSPSYSRTVKNYEVQDGIKEYRKLITYGQIKKKTNDMIEFAFFESDGKPLWHDNGMRLIGGTLLDEHNNVITGAEIVVVDSDTKEVHAYVKTNENGEYSFVLERETYDVIIRSPRHNAKVVKNFIFNGEDGFVSEMTKQSLMFRQDGEWLWISI